MTKAWRLPLIGLALLAIGAAPPPAESRTAYSLVVGDLIGQRDAPGNPCEPDEDVCVDVMLETRLTNVRWLAGNHVPKQLQVRHRAHAPFRRGARLRLAMIVGSKFDGLRFGIMVGRPENGKVCVDQSWFEPAKQGMPIPSGHKTDENGDICFRV